MNKKIFISVLFLVVIVILVWIVINNNKNASPKNTPPPVVSNSIRTYGDTINSFTIQAPGSFVSQQSTATQKTGIGTTHETSQQIEIINFAAAANAGVSIQVYEGAPSCDTVEKPNTTLAGFPAFYEDVHKTWTIDTITASYVISYYYPGRGIYHGRYGIQPSPLPQSTMDAYEKLFTNILNSFKPANPQLVSC